jgi:hypothetical protein
LSFKSLQKRKKIQALDSKDFRFLKEHKKSREENLHGPRGTK